MLPFSQFSRAFVHFTMSMFEYFLFFTVQWVSCCLQCNNFFFSFWYIWMQNREDAYAVFCFVSSYFHFFLYSKWIYFSKQKAHGLTLYHRDFVDFWVLWAFPIRGFLALWAFLTPAHVGQGQIMRSGPIWQV